jgi:hypothetical protein
MLVLETCAHVSSLAYKLQCLFVKHCDHGTLGCVLSGIQAIRAPEPLQWESSFVGLGVSRFSTARHCTLNMVSLRASLQMLPGHCIVLEQQCFQALLER